MGSFATDEYWIDAGRPELYLQANLDLISGARKSIEEGVAGDAQVDTRASVSNSVIDAGVLVGAGAVVTDSVLLAGAVIAEGAQVIRSIVAGNIAAGAELTDCVVGSGYQVSAGSQHVSELLPT